MNGLLIVSVFCDLILVLINWGFVDIMLERLLRLLFILIYCMNRVFRNIFKIGGIWKLIFCFIMDGKYFENGVFKNDYVTIIMRFFVELFL